MSLGHNCNKMCDLIDLEVLDFFHFKMTTYAQCGKMRNSLPLNFFFVKSIYSKVL